MIRLSQVTVALHFDKIIYEYAKRPFDQSKAYAISVPQNVFQPQVSGELL